ncbi:plasmid related protein [Ralstonia nicotianae]
MTESSLPALPPPRLPLGQLVATPAAITALAAADVSIFKLLNRHARGDWGDLSTEDLVLNDLAAITGQRVLSSYLLGNGQKVYFVTEWDRSSTTVLLSEEY